MSGYHSEWTERLSAYVSEELVGAERAEVEEHLAVCGACRDVLAGLAAVVARAGALPALEPPRDLWPGISSAIGGPVRAWSRAGDPSVLELPTARAAGSPEPSRAEPTRISVPRSWLAAAAAGLVAVSGGIGWWAAAGSAGSATAPAPTVADLADVPDGGAVVPVAAGAPPEDLASELAALEEVLDVARTALDPNTVRVLERNLDVIEQAIADSRRALELDPGNAFLTEHLERMYRRKLVYLQDAVRVVQWEG